MEMTNSYNIMLIQDVMSRINNAINQVDIAVQDLKYFDSDNNLDFNQELSALQGITESMQTKLQEVTK